MGFDFSALASPDFELPEGWRIVLVQNVAKVNEMSIQDGYEHSRIEYIDIASVEKGVVRVTQDLLFTDAPSRARRIVRDNDTLISTVRPNLEHYAFIKKAASNTVASTGFAVVTAKDVDPRWFYYFLTTKPVTEYLSRIADSHTSAYPAFNPDVIEKLQLPLPSSPEQRVIAHILGTLDDKIELNRRMNETLEAMARAIFKSRFLETEVAGECGKVEDIATISRESINPGDFPEEMFDHYSVPAFDEGHLPKPEAGGQIKSNKFIVSPEAVLLCKLNPRIPRVWLPAVNRNRRPICSTEFLVVVPKSEISREYLFGLFNSDPFLTSFASLVTGTSGSHQRVKPEYLLAMEATIPPRKRVENFTEIAKPLLERIALNLAESRTLAAARDALLPKLLSGEIRVGEEGLGRSHSGNW